MRSLTPVARLWAGLGVVVAFVAFGVGMSKEDLLVAWWRADGVALLLTGVFLLQAVTLFVLLRRRG